MDISIYYVQLIEHRFSSNIKLLMQASFLQKDKKGAKTHYTLQSYWKYPEQLLVFLLNFN